MKTIAISKAGGSPLRHLLESVTESHVPIRLTAHNASAVLVNWDDWQAIEETMYRLSAPNLAAKSPRGLPASPRDSSGRSSLRAA